MGKHSRTRDSILKKRRNRRKAKRTKVKKILKDNKSTVETSSETNSPTNHDRDNDVENQSTATTVDTPLSAMGHDKAVDTAKTVDTPLAIGHDSDCDNDEDNQSTAKTVDTPLSAMDHDNDCDNDEDTSDCSVFDYLETINAAAGIGQETEDKGRPVGGKRELPHRPPRSGLEKHVQRIPGYKELCKEMKSDDPLEIGFYLWQRQETNPKYFSFLRRKCEYI